MTLPFLQPPTKSSIGPILYFLLCLLTFKLKGYQAGFITVIVASAVAFFVYGMPFSLIGASFVQGFAQGMWPIAWIGTQVF